MRDRIWEILGVKFLRKRQVVANKYLSALDNSISIMSFSNWIMDVEIIKHQFLRFQYRFDIEIFTILLKYINRNCWTDSEHIS